MIESYHIISYHTKWFHCQWDFILMVPASVSFYYYYHIHIHIIYLFLYIIYSIYISYIRYVVVSIVSIVYVINFLFLGKNHSVPIAQSLPLHMFSYPVAGVKYPARIIARRSLLHSWIPFYRLKKKKQFFVFFYVGYGNLENGSWNMEYWVNTV